MQTVRVKQVPSEVVNILRRRADHDGLTFDDYLTRLVIEMGSKPKLSSVSSD